MTKGFILGKFIPLHRGHIGLIEFAQKQCDELIILICASDKETIPGCVRLKWLQETFKDTPKIKPTLFNYLEHDLPNTSISSKRVSQIWASKIQNIFPDIDIVFSSETYGDYLADFLHCKHISFEPERKTHKISATGIRELVFKNWNYIAVVARPYFVKTICIYGTESTGKSTLAKGLAAHYQTDFVPEMARHIIEQTEECTEEHLMQIAELQAKTILQKLKTARMFLFVDTDLNITRSYAKFLFGNELTVPNWIEEVNRFDLYLYLDNDSPHIQDGTRLDNKRRNELNDFHKKELVDKGIKFELITGDWQERFEKSISIIDKLSGCQK
jgi:HTH-type transcriptional regulator, transcriptional repressor of NAD biosynthesis genes